MADQTRPVSDEQRRLEALLGGGASASADGAAAPPETEESPASLEEALGVADSGSLPALEIPSDSDSGDAGQEASPTPPAGTQAVGGGSGESATRLASLLGLPVPPPAQEAEAPKPGEVRVAPLDSPRPKKQGRSGKSTFFHIDPKDLKKRVDGEGAGQAGKSGSGPNPKVDTQTSLASIVVAAELLREGSVDPERLEDARRLFKERRGQVKDDLTRDESSRQRFRDMVAEAPPPSAPPLITASAVGLNLDHIDPSVIKRLPKETAIEHTCIPLDFIEGEERLVVAMAAPEDIGAVDTLRFVTGLVIDAMPAPRQQILAALKHYHGGGGTASEGTRESKPASSGSSRLGDDGDSSEGTLAKLVHSVLDAAVEKRASDIHIEPKEDHLRVRIRVDGILMIYTKVAKVIAAHFTNRLKIMAEMDISERRCPQDGRIRRQTKRRDVEFRVSSFPVLWGEKIVLRIVDRSAPVPSLEELGLPSVDLSRVRSLLSLREGLILVTGPTGSGKTTTLYSALCEISSPQINVVTLEDPVEHEFLHMNQAQVNPVAGFNFANGLRAILRQDPNVILVGEIRDEETAAIAIQASMTGHLVLSTIHANSAAHAPLRLVNMGVEPYLVAHALQGTLAQRLVRRLCTKCRKASPTPDMPGAFEAGPGCDRCNEGYRGRLAMCEVISVDDSLRKAITDGASGARISEMAASGGYRPLRTLARERVRVGATSMAEVARVIGS